MINAIELPADSESGTRYIRFDTVAVDKFYAEKFSVAIGDKITVTGRVVGVDKGITMGRGYVRVHIEINGGWHRGGYVGLFTLGSHNRFEYVTKADCEPITEDDSEIIAMGDMPDPESDGPMCAAPSCTAVATRVGLRQIENPSPAHPEGIQSNEPVCDYHSWAWSGMWGSWDIENDATYGVVFGAEGKPMYQLERQRVTGVVSESDYRDLRDLMIAKNRAVSTGEVSLDKAPVETEVVAGDVEVGYEVRIGNKSGIVHAIDWCMDKRARIGLYVANGDKIVKVRVRPDRMITRVGTKIAQVILAQA